VRGSAKRDAASRVKSSARRTKPARVYGEWWSRKIAVAGDMEVIRRRGKRREETGKRLVGGPEGDRRL